MNMNDLMTFKKMITPAIIQIVFWLALVVVVLAGLATLVQRDGGLFGLVILIFGPVLVRVYAEVLMVLFRINDTLTEISASLEQIKHNTGQRPPT